MWEVQVAGGGSGGGHGEQLAVHGQGRVGPQVGQELVRRGEALVARPPRRHPVAGVRQGVVGEHEAVGVEGVGQRRRHAGGQRALVEGVQRVGRVHHGEAALEGGGRVVEAGVAAAAPQVGHAGVAEAVRVPAQALHEGGRRGARQRAGAGVFPAHAAHPQARLGSVQTRSELVAAVPPHDGSLVAHAGGGQRVERLAGFEGGDGRDVSGAEAGLALVGVGAAVRAPGAAVGAGAGVARVGVLWTVRFGHIGVLFQVGGGAAARAAGTALLTRGVSTL